MVINKDRLVHWNNDGSIYLLTGDKTDKSGPSEKYPGKFKHVIRQMREFNFLDNINAITIGRGEHKGRVGEAFSFDGNSYISDIKIKCNKVLLQNPLNSSFDNGKFGKWTRDGIPGSKSNEIWEYEIKNDEVSSELWFQKTQTSMNLSR